MRLRVSCDGAEHGNSPPKGLVRSSAPDVRGNDRENVPGSKHPANCPSVPVRCLAGSGPSNSASPVADWRIHHA